MKYLCLIYTDEKAMDAVPESELGALIDECHAYSEVLEKSGVLLAAEALQSVQTATTLRVRNGRLSITDGPFAETKEQLAGFYLIEAAGLHEALHVAARIPPMRLGSIEVRPIRDLAQPASDRRASHASREESRMR